MNIYYDPGTKIKVAFMDEQILIGVVDHWTSPADSDEGVQELTIIPTEGKLKGRYVNFNEKEVKHIEAIDN